MKNIKVKSVSKKILALILVPFMLSSCAKRSDCTITSKHVHKYTINGKYGPITTYINSEDMEYGKSKFDWNKDYIMITPEDEKFYKVKGDLFTAEDNWETIYNFMVTRKDYLEFYYYYTTEEDYWDGDGNYRPETVSHSGWSTNPNCRGATGDVHLNHFRFFAYKIVYENGKYVKYKSPDVDDIRQVVDNYPYISADCTSIYYRAYKYNVSDLPKLKVSDFDGVFTGPDTSTNEMHPNTK